MRFTAPETSKQNQLSQLKALRQQIQSIRNEMEFLEILAQFWPWQNMAQKVERLQQRLNLLNSQHQLYALRQNFPQTRAS